KKLISFVKGETEYLISLLPLGGYVKMYGEGLEGNIIVEKTPSKDIGLISGDRIVEVDDIDLKKYKNWKNLLGTLKLNPGNKRNLKIERDGKIIELSTTVDDLELLEAYSESEYKRGFSNQSILNRFLIVIAGPAMNIIIPFFFMPVVFMLGISVPAFLEKAPEIGFVRPDSPAYEAGFERGDKIIRIEGKKINNWRDVNISFQSNPDLILDVEIDRNGITKNLNLKAEATSDGIVAVGLREPLAAIIGDVSDNQPAKLAGIMNGDKVISIDGIKVNNWDHMSDLIKESNGRELSFTVLRDSGTENIKIKPEMEEQLNKYIIGISPKIEEIVKKYGVFESLIIGIKEAAKMTIEITILFFGFLFKLLTGKIALGTAGKTIAGPLLIAKVSGSAAQNGISSLLQFTSFISINLALINLLPIPMLDGGHVLYLLLEKIKRGPLNPKALELSQKIGFSLLIFLMFIAIYNDIARMRGDILDQIYKVVEFFR
ncbi:MAG: RIP metalloprotease RseP, partial [Candidatus Dadabacteria bacterium]|nr:RIP metalloprotease RseP [Candidatus Dadabacteria bacterium]NIQ16477.1 RIP metalloprotease RseP [Candidatus Dadabacteria bacterium]